jgi:hypothetical protein
MLPARIARGSVGGGWRSASSIAADRPPIAPRTASHVARHVPREVDGDLGLQHRRGPRADLHLRAVGNQPALQQEADERAVEGEPLQRGRRAEADLPADLALAAAHVLVAQRELLAHPLGDPVVDHASNSSSGPGIA